MSNAPTEGKVWGATVGGGLGASIATFITWLLGVLVWKAPNTAEAATDAVSAVPYPVIGILYVAIGLGGIFYGGWKTKHTPRPKDDGMVWSVPIENATIEELPAKENESKIEYEARNGASYPVPEYPNPRDVDQDGRDDETGRFVAKTE